MGIFFLIWPWNHNTKRIRTANTINVVQIEVSEWIMWQIDFFELSWTHKAAHVDFNQMIPAQIDITKINKSGKSMRVHRYESICRQIQPS